MTTIFKDKTGKTIQFITQQYEVGLYLAIYTEGNSIPEQTGLDCNNEADFHKELKENYNKRRLELISTPV